MGLSEDKDLVEIPDNLVGEGIENIGPDEDRGRVPEAEEESHYIAEDAMGQSLDSRISRE